MSPRLRKEPTKKWEDNTVAIVGGSPGGLTLARLLQMRGVAVRVYERDAGRDAHVRGATLDLHEESGLRALRQAGLMGAFRANYRPGADRLVITDRNAGVILDKFSSEDLGAERPEIDRGPLRELLLHSLRLDTVVWGRRCVSLTRLADSVRLHFADGTSASADVVVGADGANPQVRPHVTPVKPVYAGVTVVEGAVPGAASAALGFTRCWGSAKSARWGTGRRCSSARRVTAACPFTRDTRPPKAGAAPAASTSRSGLTCCGGSGANPRGGAARGRSCSRNAAPPFIPRPQYVMPLDRPWEPRPDVTLFGDPAHVVPPYAGEGVNAAMLDALELAECPTSGDFPNTGAAIAAYEAAMRTRAAQVVP